VVSEAVTEASFRPYLTPRITKFVHALNAENNGRKGGVVGEEKMEQEND
jgi:hypothetical protein